MSTATVPPTAAPVRVPQGPALIGLADYVEPGERLLLTGVRYADYERLVEWRDAHRRTVRVAYDSGGLEIMVVSNLHERYRKRLDVLIVSWIVETGGEYCPSGQLTHHRGDIEKGFEPDECYYIQNWRKVSGFREIDFTKDPPPDLAVEVEVSRTVLPRLPLYAAFKIPEVWRWDGEHLTILLLRPDGTYRESSVSLALPTVPWPEFIAFLRLPDTVAYAEFDRQVRAWVRSLPPAPTA
ncbi:Uma2 family endonuclease [Gemmata sp.]|uniref:Uma2 family endonuclease n=1 Tax=Gemmata sp. TaxID=1914242 RepID=UPI003F6EEE91